MHNQPKLKRFNCLECGEVEMRKGGPHHVCLTCVFTLPKYERQMKQVMSGQREAVRAVAAAIYSGALPKPADKECVDCGSQAHEYDHRDYNAPLDVEPVCRSCNRQRGHALPAHGFITKFLATGGVPYKRKRLLRPLLNRMGIDAPELDDMPPLLGSEHWQILSRHFVVSASHA